MVDGINNLEAGHDSLYFKIASSLLQGTSLVAIMLSLYIYCKSDFKIKNNAVAPLLVLEIRGNEMYSQRLLTNDVLNVLENTGKLQHTGNQQFCNIENFPWISVIAVNSHHGNYGKDEDFNSEWVNLIAIVGSKSDPENETLYVNMLTEIAEKINWELILEEDDNENKNIVLKEKLR